LRTCGFDTLNKLAEPRLTNLWSQGWKPTISLGLEEEEVIELERYITIFKISQIKLRDSEDELIWDTAPSGIYTPKFGYIKLNLHLYQ